MGAVWTRVMEVRWICHFDICLELEWWVRRMCMFLDDSTGSSRGGWDLECSAVVIPSRISLVYKMYEVLEYFVTF